MIINRQNYYNIICTWTLLTFVLVFVQNIIGPTLNGQISQILIYGSLLLFVLQKDAKTVPAYIWIYSVVLLFSTCIHYANPEYEQPFLTPIHWIFLMFFLSIALKNYNGKWVLIILITFYISNCLLGVYERVTQTHILVYSSDILEAQEKYGERQDSFFRAFALLGHPLYNANVTSMIIAFVLLSKNINKYVKIALIIIGALALWAFNSRAAILITAGIFVYYYLCNYKYTFILFVCVVSFFFLQPLIQIMTDNEILGRLSEDIYDESSETRLLAYMVFGAQNWDTESRLGGLGIIYYPMSETSLENGVLLTLGYWGWYAGAYKVWAELYSTYKAIKDSFDFNGKVIIFMASWGIAFCNNNSFSFLVLSFLILSIVAFNGFDKSLHQEKDQYKTTKK